MGLVGFQLGFQERFAGFQPGFQVRFVGFHWDSKWNWMDFCWIPGGVHWSSAEIPGEIWIGGISDRIPGGIFWISSGFQVWLVGFQSGLKVGCWGFSQDSRWAF